jgi:CRISPR-associated endonuclease Cas1
MHGSNSRQAPQRYLTASIGGLDDARLRRAQALIVRTEHRLPIARELLEAKIKGQLAVLDSFGLGGGSAVRGALARLDRADRIDRVLIAEAQTAEAYWDAWADVPMTFARRDRVPDHWRTFGARRSPLTMAPRNAANPVNAFLNLLYKFAEIETRIALIARGIDPSFGIFHQDEANRSSLAADVMEPVRPHVDAFVLNLARTRTFSAKDFAETRESSCRIASPLAQKLAPTMATWAKLVAPYAEAVARHVARLAKNGLGGADPDCRGRSRASEGASTADRIACCTEGRSIGADHDGGQCVQQLRCQALDSQALILRSMPARSARGGAARGYPGLPRRGTSEDRGHACSGPRSHYHA